MIRLSMRENPRLCRALHEILFTRLVQFCKDYTPEVEVAETVVSAWLNRLYLGDESIHILVDFDDDMNIVGHAVMDIQNIFGTKMACCHQVQGERNSIDALHRGVEYLEKIAAESGASSVIVYLAKNSAVLKNKFGYQQCRVVMMKRLNDE